MTEIRRGWVLLFAVAGATAVLDQGTKLWAEADLKDRPGQRIMIAECCFDLTYQRNPGAAFSLLAERGPRFRQVFFVVVSLAAVGLMIHLYRRMGRRRPVFEWAVGLLAGGAAGNLVDRVRFNEVIDFIHVHVHDAHWPTFNVADTALVVGIGLVLLDAFRRRREEAPDGAQRQRGRRRRR